MMENQSPLLHLNKLACLDQSLVLLHVLVLVESLNGENHHGLLQATTEKIQQLFCKGKAILAFIELMMKVSPSFLKIPPKGMEMPIEV